MSARRIVEGFDELEDSHSLLALRSEATPIDQLAFSVAKKLSHIALSYASPTEPVDGRPPASLQRLRLPPSGNARTHAPNPRACDQIAPDLSSVAGTPADKRFDNAASDTSKINFKGVHKPGQLKLIRIGLDETIREWQSDRLQPISTARHHTQSRCDQDNGCDDKGLFTARFSKRCQKARTRQDKSREPAVQDWHGRAARDQRTIQPRSQ